MQLAWRGLHTIMRIFTSSQAKAARYTNRRTRHEARQFAFDLCILLSGSCVSCDVCRHADTDALDISMLYTHTYICLCARVRYKSFLNS